MKGTQQRKLIRDHVATALEAGLAADYPDLVVFNQRRTVVDEQVSQYINVWFAKGDVSTVSDESRGDEASLVITINIKQIENIDDSLDEIANKVESIIDADYSLGGLVQDCEQSEWRYGQGEQTPWYWLGMAYQVDYETDLT